MLGQQPCVALLRSFTGDANFGSIFLSLLAACRYTAPLPSGQSWESRGCVLPDKHKMLIFLELSEIPTPRAIQAFPTGSKFSPVSQDDVLATICLQILLFSDMFCYPPNCILHVASRHWAFEAMAHFCLQHGHPEHLSGPRLRCFCGQLLRSCRMMSARNFTLENAIFYSIFFEERDIWWWFTVLFCSQISKVTRWKPQIRICTAQQSFCIITNCGMHPPSSNRKRPGVGRTCGGSSITSSTTYMPLTFVIKMAP